MNFKVSQSNKLLMVLSTNQITYFRGEPVKIYLFKLNISDQPVTLTYPTTQKYDFIVSTPFGEVWRWSFDRVFLPVVEQVILKPGESLSYSVQWPKINNHGFRVPSGIYKINGWNTAKSQLPETRKPSTYIRLL